MRVEYTINLKVNVVYESKADFRQLQSNTEFAETISDHINSGLITNPDLTEATIQIENSEINVCCK